MRIAILLSIISMFACRKNTSGPNQSTMAQNTIALKPIYSGTWWAEKLKDSLVITFYKIDRDSVKYRSTCIIFDNQLTHVIGFEPTDDNLILKNNGTEYSFRREH